MACRWPNKQRHYSEQAAQKAAASLRKRKGDTSIHAYTCGKHWHVGHNLGVRLRQALRERA